jgi:hypothetical protein
LPSPKKGKKEKKRGREGGRKGKKGGIEGGNCYLTQDHEDLPVSC